MYIGGDESEMNRSITTDGTFLYITSRVGAGLVKVGTGLHGTIQSVQLSLFTNI